GPVAGCVLGGGTRRSTGGGTSGYFARSAIPAEFTRTALSVYLAPSSLGSAAECFACRGLPGPTELLSDISVAIGYAAAVGWIMRPVFVDNVGAIEAVVPDGIDLDPVAPPIDATPDRRPHGCARSERDDTPSHPARRVPIKGLVLGIGPCAVHHARIVDRHE